jgi:hypothetical protein
MTKKIITVLVITCLLGLLVLYIKRGGLVMPQISKVQTLPFYMIATSYKGMIAKKEQGAILRDKIRQTHEYIDSGKLQGTLTLVYEGNPDQAKDSIQAYIGVIVADSVAMAMPKGYEIRHFEAMRVVRAEIKAHVSVAPNPAKINEMLRDFARKSGLTLQDRHIEKYISEEHIISEIMVK